VQDTGRFSVLVQSFKNSKDAFEFLNELVKVLPGAKAVRRKQNVDVVGPQRTSLSSVKADSAFLAVKNISSRISASRDFTPIPSLYVSLYIKDKSDNQPLVAHVNVFSRREDEILASGIVENGRVYFVFPKEQADIGLTVTSDGFLPKSIRVSLADFTTTQKFSEIIALDRIPKEKEFSIELNNILFDFDSDELTKVSQKELVNVTNLLSSYTIDTLEIIGHCDSLGTDAYNQRLGLNRAKSVATFIKSQKLNATPKVTSMGELSPLLSNSTEFGRSLNRRVEFKMSISDQESEKVWNLESSSPKEKDSGTASTETSGSNL
jgi:outer membrane protein OmpA-like peptidoglycan-associated protein